MSSELNHNNERLRENALSAGAVMLGVAAADKIPLELPASAAGMPLVVAVACRLSDEVVDSLTDGPTPLYKHHYRQTNYLLDSIALRLQALIIMEGYRALAFPASQIINWTPPMAGEISHRHVAWAAGLGWFGRNNLLVNRVHGCRIRLVTIATNFPLTPDEPVDDNCGSCRLCLKACPAGAIETKTADFKIDACYNQLETFRRQRGIGVHICGLCIKACPPGR
ncbi:4Fe-4S double cluster binding domain-containing protein [candidate division KSB1 bacterium]